MWRLFIRDAKCVHMHTGHCADVRAAKCVSVCGGLVILLTAFCFICDHDHQRSLSMIMEAGLLARDKGLPCRCECAAMVGENQERKDRTMIERSEE